MNIDDKADEVLIGLAIEEDLHARGDVTSQALIDSGEYIRVSLTSRQTGVLSGVQLANKTLKTVDPNLIVEWRKSDGDSLQEGEVIATVEGKYRSILAAERTTLNFLQHLSGVASLTRQFVDILSKSGSSTIVRDTRKTLPGYRKYEKAAVVHGGGKNHRMGLYDAFLVKDNHLARHDLNVIVKRCRDFDPSLPLEVEVDNLEQLASVVKFEPDMILLDNFAVDDVVKAIDIAGSIPLEISGGVNIDNVESYGATNVKYIAIGALTHSASSIDIGCDVL